VGLWERLLYSVVWVELLWDCERDYCIVLCGVIYCGTVRETTL